MFRAEIQRKVDAGVGGTTVYYNDNRQVMI